MSLKNSLLKESQVLYNAASNKTAAGRSGAGGLLLVVLLVATLALSFAVSLAGAVEHPAGDATAGSRLYER